MVSELMQRRIDALDGADDSGPSATRARHGAKLYLDQVLANKQMAQDLEVDQGSRFG